MSERTMIDVSEIIERQKPGRFLVTLVVISWIITFFDGYDSNVIAFAAPYLAAEYQLDRVMIGNIFSSGLVGTLIGGFVFGYLGDRIGRRPGIILATAAFGFLTLAFVLANSYASLLALRFLDGIAVGGMLPLAWALNIEYAPKRYRSTVVTVTDWLFGRLRDRRSDRCLVDPAIRVAIGVHCRRRAVADCSARPRAGSAGICAFPREQGVSAATCCRPPVSPNRPDGVGGCAVHCRR